MNFSQFGLCDQDVFAREVTNEWRELLREQTKCARLYFNLAEEEASQLEKASRQPVWSALMLHRKILDAIEDDDYHNKTSIGLIGPCSAWSLLSLINNGNNNNHISE